MQIHTAIQIIIDEQLGLGKSYRDSIKALEEVIRELKMLDDVHFIAENPLNEEEKRFLRAYYWSHVNAGPMIQVVKMYRDRVKNADLMRSKLACDTYLKYLDEEVVKKHTH